MENDYTQNIERAVEFIEMNLTQPLTVDMIAREACYSKFHFLRIFAAHTGENLGEYVRRRRLTESANKLISTEQLILNIALEYQFESQEAFTRSFKNVYQMTPGAYRKKGVEQVLFQRRTFSQETLRHMKKMKMEPEIKIAGDKMLVGMSSKTSLNNNKIPQMWQDFLKRIPEVKNRANTDRFLLNRFNPDLKVEDITDDWEFEKWVAVEVESFASVPKDLETHTNQGGKYAVYIHKGTVMTFVETSAYVFGTLFPKTGLVFDERDDFVRYGPKFLGPMNEESEVEIWIPIK